MASNRSLPDAGTREGRLAIAEEALQVVEHIVGDNPEVRVVYFDSEASPFRGGGETQRPAQGRMSGDPVLRVGLWNQDTRKETRNRNSRMVR